MIEEGTDNSKQWVDNTVCGGTGAAKKRTTLTELERRSLQFLMGIAAHVAQNKQAADQFGHSHLKPKESICFLPWSYKETLNWVEIVNDIIIGWFTSSKRAGLTMAFGLSPCNRFIHDRIRLKYRKFRLYQSLFSNIPNTLTYYFLLRSTGIV